MKSREFTRSLAFYAMSFVQRSICHSHVLVDSYSIVGADRITLRDRLYHGRLTLGLFTNHAVGTKVQHQPAITNCKPRIFREQALQGET